jgi:hypothetical protein
MSVVEISPMEVRRIVTEYIKSNLDPAQEIEGMAKPVMALDMVSRRPSFVGMQVVVRVKQPKYGKLAVH